MGFDFNASWFKTQNFDIVIDIGAHEGEYSLEFHKLWPQAEIYAFEPIPECFKILSQRFSEQGENLHCYNVALGSYNHTANFYINNFTYASSLLPMEPLHIQVFPQSEKFTRELVEVRTLDSYFYFQKNILGKKIFIKVDVQGYEDAVLSGGINTLKHSNLVIIEVSFQPLYKGQSTFDSVYAIMKNCGFDFMGMFDQLTNPEDRSILQGDCIFGKGKS